jgi:hypothetical protein
MSAASNYTELNVMKALLHGVAFPLPTKTYVALHTASPGETGANEVPTTGWTTYARREAEQGGAIGTGWSTPVDGVCQNAKQLTYPSQNGVPDVTVTHWSVWDAVTGGNCLFATALTTARTLATGDIFVFDINALTAQQS